MYAKVLSKYAAERNGVYVRTLSGAGRRAFVSAILESDAGQPWFVWGREDRADSGEAQVSRLMVQRVSVGGDFDPAERKEMYEALMHNMTFDGGQAYYMEGGRELKSFLEMRPFMSKGSIVETDWLLDMQSEMHAYAQAIQSSEDARAAVMSYAEPESKITEEMREAVQAYASDEPTETVRDADMLRMIERYSNLGNAGASDVAECRSTTESEILELLKSVDANLS
jgi:hypothetical protein